MQAGSALLRWRAVPNLRGVAGALHRLRDFLRRGCAYPADLVARVGRVEHWLPAVGAGLLGRGSGVGRRARFGHRRGKQRLRAAQQTHGQRGQLLLVRQVQARRVQARLRTQVGQQLARQSNASMGRTQLATLRLDVQGFADRVGHQLGDGHVGVANAVDERGVGTVFQQAAHQVGQQRFVRADRRVDAAGPGQLAVGDAARDLVV